MANLIQKAADYLYGATISIEVLRDKLSEFLAVEKGGFELYGAALGLVLDREITKRFKTFRIETWQHQRIISRLMEKLGMDPSYQSAGAAMAEEKTRALLKTMTNTRGFSAKAAETNAVENIVLAETKDQADCEFLARLARRATDERLRLALRAAVSEVEPQEDQHLNWSKKELARLEFAAVTENRAGTRKARCVSTKRRCARDELP
jgi:rubrerythrin